ncbi:MAG TPA: cell division ATP-binding protein FtsE [Candidatus Limnocylindrales bacterium]|nr:cell division ATP-binding protein FtsE [Candidatus Limnocylindrales bacterium]
MIGTLERPVAGARAAESAEPVISMVDVGMTYPNGKVALADVNVSIPAGDFVFLVGPSGAGKSTFIRLLIREQLPTSGRVVVAGRDLLRMRRREVPKLRRRIGIVFQDFRLLPAKTVFENVAFALEVTGAGRTEIRRRVPQLLNLVGLHEHNEHLPTQLSGGEQQRVAIARALVHDPAMLIADEPTGNLDPVTSWEIIQLLIQINGLGTTVLMATHNQEIVNAMRRRVLALEHGTLVRDESGAAYEREY